MRQLLTYWPPRIVSAKCTFQLSRSSLCAIAAAMPPSAMTVCALPSSDLQIRPTDDAGVGRFNRRAQSRAARPDDQDVVCSRSRAPPSEDPQSVQIPIEQRRT